MANAEFALSPYRTSGAKIFAGVASLFLIGVAIMLGMMAFCMGSGSFVWDGKSLRLDGAMTHQEIAAADLKVSDAKLIDADNDAALKLGSRKHGMKAPGFAEGWFSLENGEKALVFVSGDRGKVVYVPTKKDFSVLVTPTDSDAMLAALKTAPAQPMSFALSAPPVTARLVFIVPLIVVLPLILVFILAIGAPNRVKAQLTDKGLRVQSLLSAKEIPYGDIEKDSIAVIKLGQGEPRSPRLRTFGLGIPGLLLGWTRLANGEKALAYVSDPSQAVYAKTKNGYSVIFTSKDADAMAAALRAR